MQAQSTRVAGEGPDAVIGGDPSSHTLSLAPGRFYRRTWIFPACGLGLAFIIIATPESTVVSFVEAASVASALVLASLLVPLYYKPVRTIVADSQGIRFLVGRRVRKVLAWEKVSRVDMGPRHRLNGLLGVYDGFGLMVVGRSRADSINVVDAWFNAEAKALPAFAEALERMAETRSIPVYSRFGTW